MNLLPLPVPPHSRFDGYAVISNCGSYVGDLCRPGRVRHRSWHRLSVRCEDRNGAPTGTRSIGPVWDGNEVWLLAADGTLFFAFPLLCSSAFSGFYLPLTIVLWLIVLRGIRIELRSHFNDLIWRTFFDGVFSFSSALLASFSEWPWRMLLVGSRSVWTTTSFCRCGRIGSSDL
jgi:hypothetical protein